MSRAVLQAVFSVLAVGWCMVAGCADGGVDGSQVDDDAGGAAIADASAPQNGPCVNQPPPGATDPSKLPTCCTDGPAHCVPSKYVPSDETAMLATCSGGYCVPDSFITNPNFVPASCKAFNGTDGACLSVCFPPIAQYKSVLTQSTCAASERCAPCTNPLTQKPSGACEIGKTKHPPCSDSGGGGGPPPPPEDAAPECPHKGPPVIDPNTLPSCFAGGGAHCLQASLVPQQMQSKLSPCTSNGNQPGLCVPDVFIESGGQFIPATCTSIDGGEGRCMSMALPDIGAQKDSLPQSTCQSYERCAPCYNPLDGTDTGVCHIACDPGPTKPPVVFKTCCNENNVDEGTCIPDSMIPQSQQQSLKTDVCASNHKCIPTEMVKAGPNYKGKPCTGFNFLSGNYNGVCLSDCLDFGIGGFLLDQGSCDDIHKCAPCTNPLTGQPTGAPGC